MNLESRIYRACAICEWYQNGRIDLTDFKRELNAIEPNTYSRPVKESMFVSNTQNADFYIDIQFTLDNDGYWRLDEYNIGEYEE